MFQCQNRRNYRCSCNICVQAKMHQISYPTLRDRLGGLSPGARVSSTIMLIIMQTFARKGYYYAFFIVYHATKTSCGFPLKT